MPQVDNSDRAIAAIARRQHGAFNRGQALEAGLTRTKIEGRLARGLWERLDYGVFRMAGTPSTWRQQLVAACLAGPAVASHRSAAELWSFPGTRRDLIEVTALRHRRRKCDAVIWHESYLLSPDQMTEVDGIQVTRPLRTFLDIAGVIERDELEVVRDDGIRRGLFTAASGLEMVQRLGPLRRGARLAEAVLETAVGTPRPPDSVLETRFAQLIRDASLPEPVAQYPITDGDRTIRVDFAFPKARLAVELDGEEYHWGERAECRDRSRDRLLARIGWRVLRFTWNDVVRRPDEVVADVAGAIAAFSDASLMHP